jgi:N6-adenosine-specific RNA methylase IME4
MGAVSHKAWCAVTRYRTIYADPPWPERGGGKSKRGADRHYNVMTVKQIKALPVGDLADPAGCVLWLWATGNYLADAIDCAREWGFRVVNFRPWVKAVMREVMIPPGLQSNGGECFAALPQNPGLGQYMRCDAEILLLCVRGKVTMPPIKTRQTIYAPRGKHSVKPDCVRVDIQTNYSGPRLEMFARQRHEGWDAFGDQVEGSIVLPGAAQLELGAACPTS